MSCKIVSRTVKTDIDYGIVDTENRYDIVSESGEIIDNAQGYGYKTYQSAQKAAWYKFKGGKQNHKFGDILVDSFHYLALFGIGATIVWSATHDYIEMMKGCFLLFHKISNDPLQPAIYGLSCFSVFHSIP